MTKDEALHLIQRYAEVASVNEIDPVVSEIDDRWSGGSENKAMRWLGFCQGYLVAKGVFTLDEVKEHSRTKEIAK